MPCILPRDLRTKICKSCKLLAGERKATKFGLELVETLDFSEGTHKKSHQGDGRECFFLYWCPFARLAIEIGEFHWFRLVVWPIDSMAI